jgi:hypothetical protein
LGGGGGGGRSSNSACSFVSVSGKLSLLGSGGDGLEEDGFSSEPIEKLEVLMLEVLGKIGGDIDLFLDEFGTLVVELKGEGGGELLVVMRIKEEPPPVIRVGEEEMVRDGGKGNPDEPLPEEAIDGLRDE